jgi:hypothetical protein
MFLKQEQRPAPANPEKTAQMRIAAEEQDPPWIASCHGE